MAYPQSITPAEAWALGRRQANSLRTGICPRYIALFSGNNTVEEARDCYDELAGAKTIFNDMAAIPGIDAYVSSLPGLGSVVVTTETANVVAEIDAALSWLDTNVSGLSLTGDSFSAPIDSKRSIATQRFGAGATATLRTALQAIIDAIDAAT